MRGLNQSPGGTDKTPILFLDINFGRNEISRIVIFEGDEPTRVVDNFSKTHGKRQRS